MIEYRFTLQKYERGSKLTCPKCGRKQCFVKYVDIEGQIAFPDYVGRWKIHNVLPPFAK